MIHIHTTSLQILGIEENETDNVPQLEVYDNKQLQLLVQLTKQAHFLSGILSMLQIMSFHTTCHYHHQFTQLELTLAYHLDV
ncbi:hypothetical protein KP509_03G012000 [Ceratopteris richardii]|uniref:Uncharacterized protein n=1 Tax=Ceratopteris richardii TaxID=49495 RepID=A0A8T2V3Y9_CERRI|nr:hypothetical protein KP509_03G012000 [Ceratopteris richardii]